MESDEILKSQVDVQECVLGFESWGFPSTEMVLQWDDSLNYLTPDINKTLNQHTMTYKFAEILPIAYGNSEGKEVFFFD